MYLVDTNIISEARKGSKANSGVQKIFQLTAPEDIYLSAQTIVKCVGAWKISGIVAIYRK